MLFEAFLDEAVQDYGDVVRVGPKTVAVMDPEIILSVLGYEGHIDEVMDTLVGVLHKHVENSQSPNISDWLYFCR